MLLKRQVKHVQVLLGASPVSSSRTESITYSYEKDKVCPRGRHGVILAKYNVHGVKADKLALTLQLTTLPERAITNS